MNHEQKKRIAQKMLSPEERRNKTSMWDSRAWNDRKDKIAKRVSAVESRQKAAAIERRKRKEDEKSTLR